MKQAALFLTQHLCGLSIFIHLQVPEKEMFHHSPSAVWPFLISLPTPCSHSSCSRLTEDLPWHSCGYLTCVWDVCLNRLPHFHMWEKCEEGLTMHQHKWSRLSSAVQFRRGLWQERHKKERAFLLLRSRFICMTLLWRKQALIFSVYANEHLFSSHY